MLYGKKINNKMIIIIFILPTRENPNIWFLMDCITVTAELFQIILQNEVKIKPSALSHIPAW